MNLFRQSKIYKILLLLIVLFPLYLHKAYAIDISPVVPVSNSVIPGLAPQVGGEELSTASTNLANFSDIKGAYYDATYKRIVFIGITTGSPKYNEDDMAVAIRSMLYNNVIPDVTINDDPSSPSGSTALVTYTAGLKDTNFGSTLFNTDYKYKQYAIGYTSTGTPIASKVTSYKSVVERYLALTGSPISGNESSYTISPQNITLKNDTTSSSIVFTNLTMQATTQALNPSNDPLWNQAANNFSTDITTNYDQYATETPELAKVKQLSKMVSVLKWINDYSIQSDFHSLQNYTPQYTSTPTTVQKVTTPSGYSAQGGVNYNTPNTYLPDDGTAAGLKTSAQSGSSSKEDVTWTFTNNGQSYQAVAIAANAFKSLGAYSTAITDLSIPIAGDLSLGFRRTYSSYSLAQTGSGIGWSYFPAQLDFNMYPSSGNYIICGANVHYAKLATESPFGHETFTYSCGSNSYVADDSSFHSNLIENTDGTFTLLMANQIKYNFNAMFYLTSQVDKIGNTINFIYDNNDRLISIADTHSHALTVAYNGQNLISSITDWTMRKVQYTYDANGRLIIVIDPLNNNTIYGYDANNRLTTITDRNNQVVLTNTFNPDAKIATQKSASNITNTFLYDTINKTITQTDNNNRVNKIYYDNNARILQNTDTNNKSTFYTYGTESSPLTVKDKNNNTTTYTYDPKGNMTTITYPDTKVVTYSYDSNNRVTNIADTRYSPTKNTSYTYNANGTISQKT